MDPASEACALIPPMVHLTAFHKTCCNRIDGCRITHFSAFFRAELLKRIIGTCCLPIFLHLFLDQPLLPSCPLKLLLSW